MIAHVMVRFLSSNKNKHLEYERLLGQVELYPIELPEIQAVDSREVVSAKLNYARDLVDGPILVDDTALHVTSLGGFPGALVKWVLDTMGAQTFAEIVLQRSTQAATAKTTIGISRERGHTEFFEGECDGEIVLPRGDAFGWDSIFQPAGSVQTFAQMRSEEKDLVSPRGRACAKLQARKVLEE